MPVQTSASAKSWFLSPWHEAPGTHPPFGSSWLPAQTRRRIALDLLESRYRPPGTRPAPRRNPGPARKENLPLPGNSRTLRPSPTSFVFSGSDEEGTRNHPEPRLQGITPRPSLRRHPMRHWPRVEMICHCGLRSRITGKSRLQPLFRCNRTRELFPTL